MTFWSLTNSDFQTNQTFHQFHDIDTELDLNRLWVVSSEHLQRVWHASRERLPFRTPGSIPHCWTCLCSNCWDQIPRTCHVFTRTFTSNTPWFFLDFAFNIFEVRIFISKKCQLLPPPPLRIKWSSSKLAGGGMGTYCIPVHVCTSARCDQATSVRLSSWLAKQEVWVWFPASPLEFQRLVIFRFQVLIWLNTAKAT